ncbi:sperm microtubule associated protein 2-like [Melanerpes formicivorus]|uniref:sperm microtubule associated protein 2-like n=1 Tax=Melanerpes formicivorus TaxID=211600 RepID=UPI00358EAFEB
MATSSCPSKICSGCRCSSREEHAGEGTRCCIPASALLCCCIGKVSANTSISDCQELVSQKDAKGSSHLCSFSNEEQAAQPASVTELLSSSLLHSGVPCCLPAYSCDRFDRIKNLAKPKKAACAHDPRLVWGNQETIWPLSRGAVSARLFPRTAALAKPKKDFSKNQCRPLFMYSCGRESTIWERPPVADFSFPSDRLRRLSEPKKCQAAYLQQRPRQSPEWLVSPAARGYKASPRILELALPKVLHPEFLPAREVPTQVTNAAALAKASSRLQLLAKPRVREVNCCYENICPESVIRPLSKFSLEAIASPRILELARAKGLHPNYVPLRDVEWPVTKAAKHAVATPRLVELAQPCKRPSMSSAQFNPDAFTVKETAKKATCSARIQELARPIQR